ncbi:MAG TPA: HDOD domain-containing protein [Terriglobales bacterium]|nr:HDOD domain-containing protein [Terriglobales bacterium]
MQQETQTGSAGIPIRPWLAAEAVHVPPGSCGYAPPFPALPSTLVALDLLLAGASVDLDRLVSAVRTDPGFTAEVLRLSHRHLRRDPLSLQTSIVHLGQNTLRRATQIVPVWTRGLSHTRICRLRWRLKRTRLVALAAEAASACIGDISPESAYLAGLLHDLPGLTCLGQGCHCTVTEFQPSLEAWNLPEQLVEVMRWHRQPWYAPPEHTVLAQRIAAVRAWVNEIQLSSTSLSAGWRERVCRRSEWERLPNCMEVLHELSGKLDAWRLWSLD